MLLIVTTCTIYSNNLIMCAINSNIIAIAIYNTYFISLWTISSLFIRWLVLVTNIIRVFRLLDQSFKTFPGSLLWEKVMIPAGLSIRAYIVFLVTNSDKNVSATFEHSHNVHVQRIIVINHTSMNIYTSNNVIYNYLAIIFNNPKEERS